MYKEDIIEKQQWIVVILNKKVMEIQNKILDSLLDDINRELKLDHFLESTSFKRSMAQIGIYEAYCEIYKEVESSSNIYMVGIDSLYRIDAFKTLLDRLYSKFRNEFFFGVIHIISNLRIMG